MHIGSATAFGILCTLALITAVGIYAGKKVKSARDFTTGSNLGAPMIAGSLIGTLVGGSSTIGTAQLAFDYGFPPGGSPWGAASAFASWPWYLPNPSITAA